MAIGQFKIRKWVRLVIFIFNGVLNRGSAGVLEFLEFKIEKMETGGTPVLRFCFVPFFICPFFPPFVDLVLAWMSNGEKSSKFQAPTSRETSNTKSQSTTDLIWTLELLWSLDVGAWSFLQGCWRKATRRRDPPPPRLRRDKHRRSQGIAACPEDSVWQAEGTCHNEFW